MLYQSFSRIVLQMSLKCYNSGFIWLQGACHFKHWTNTWTKLKIIERLCLPFSDICKKKLILQTLRKSDLSVQLHFIELCMTNLWLPLKSGFIFYRNNWLKVSVTVLIPSGQLFSICKVHSKFKIKPKNMITTLIGSHCALDFL